MIRGALIGYLLLALVSMFAAMDANAGAYDGVAAASVNPPSAGDQTICSIPLVHNNYDALIAECQVDWRCSRQDAVNGYGYCYTTTPSTNTEVHAAWSACPAGQNQFSWDGDVCVSIPEDNTCAGGEVYAVGECYPPITVGQCEVNTGGNFTIWQDDLTGAVICEQKDPPVTESYCSQSLFEAGTCSAPAEEGGCPAGFTYGTFMGEDMCVWNGGDSEPDIPDPDPWTEPEPGTEPTGPTPGAGTGTTSTTTTTTINQTSVCVGCGPNGEDVTTTTSGTNTSTSSGTMDLDMNMDLPGFCSWASAVCNFFEWAGGEPGEVDTYTPAETSPYDSLTAQITEFKGEIEVTPIYGAISSAFDFSVSGTCPVWNVDVWIFQFTIDQLCSDIIPWLAISSILLLVATFLAIRIAVT